MGRKGEHSTSYKTSEKYRVFTQNFYLCSEQNHPVFALNLRDDEMFFSSFELGVKQRNVTETLKLLGSWHFDRAIVKNSLG